MITKSFILAGRAVFTVDNGRGEHYTYRVGASKDGKAFFVSLLTGPQNTSDYTYLGLLNQTDGGVRLTKASRYKEDTKPVRVVRWALAKIWAEADFPPGYAVHHEGRCCRCGRMLTVPESIESGIGPECAKYVGGRSHAYQA